MKDFKKASVNFAFCAAIFALAFLAQSLMIQAATRIWDGGGATNNFSEAANWSADTVPTGADDIVFDATNTKSAVIDAPVTVNSISVNSGYTGTLTQNAALTATNAFTQSAGIFQGTAANASFGFLILNGGSVFNAPSGILSLTSQTNYYLFTFNGGTFNHNGGTVNIGGRTDLNYFNGQIPTFQNLNVNQPLTLFNAAITVNGILTLAQPLSGAQVNLGGDVNFTGNFNNGSTILNFGGTATRTTAIGGTIIGNPVTLNNPNITVTTAATSGTVTWTQKVVLQAGTLNQSAADYVFSVGAGFNNPGFSVAGGTFQGSAGKVIFNTTIGISSGNLNAGSGEIGTNIANCPVFPQANYHFQQSGGTFTGGAGNARFCDLRRTGGSFTAPAGNLTILAYGDFTGAGFNANGGTLTVGNGVTIVAPGVSFFNVALEGASGHGFAGTPKPNINGTFNLTEGTFASGEVAANGDVIYGTNFTGGGGRIFFEDAATRTVNLPARNILLGMTLDNPNITVTTSGAGASTFTGAVEIKRGLMQQGSANLSLGGNNLTVSGGTFAGSSGDLTVANLIVSGGAFTGGTGLLTGSFGAGINQSGGTFSTNGNIDITYFTQSGGTFNAPSGLMIVVADWNHASGGVFNANGGSVKFTGYNTFNCINQININVPVTETFHNLEIANSFCNARFITAGDTLIVNNDLRLSYALIGGGKIRPLGTTTIDATNTLAATGSTVIEYVTPNANFVINSPSTTVGMLPVEMNAANSALTSSGTGRINFRAMTLTAGTVNQGAGIWDITNPGFQQTGGIFNGSAAELFVSNGAGNPMLSGGTFNSGTGKVTTSFRMTGGTMTIAGDMDTANLSLEGGTFNAPLGTLSIFQSFSHTLGGTFNARTGTVKTSTAAGVFGVFFDVNSSETFNNLQFNGTNNNANHVIAAGDTFVVNGALNFNGRGVNGGSIVANGDVNYTNFGGYQNATTLVKFQDTAARTVTFSNTCESYFQPTLVDNPNITVNTGCNDANASLTWTSLDLRRGTVNAGDARSTFTGNFTQSGGTFNAGNNAVNPSTTVAGNFTLSGGDFNAAPFTNFGGNYTHTGGGDFNYGTGTVVFGGLGGTIDVNSTENFYNVRFEQASTGTTKTIASGDTLTANGSLEFRAGYVSGGTIDAKRNVAVFPQASGGNTNLIFSGATDQIYTNTNGISINGAWTVNKPNSLSAAENSFAPAAPTNLLISGNIGNNLSATLVPLDIVSGNVVQTGNYNHNLASLVVSTAASFVNEFAGTITLGGNVTNNGIIRLNANGAGCQTDSIALRSTNATQRSWNGSGYFLMTDVDVSGQTGTPIINVYNGTNSGNNGVNWVFNPSCFAPTSASVSLGGRVLNADGKGISGVRVVLTDANGLARAAVTNNFGNYQFDEVAAGQTVVISVVGKKFVFANPTRVMNVSENAADINFTAEER